MTEQPPDYTQSPFVPAVHQERPPQSDSLSGLGQDAARGLRGKLIDSILQLVVQALTGSFIPGIPAFTQLFTWAFDILPAQITAPLSALVTLLVTIFDSIPIIGPPIGNAIEDLAALLGLINSNTNQANSTNNPAVAASDARIAALEAAAAGNSGGYDDFNGATLSAKWGVIAGVSSLTIGGGFANNSGTRRGNKFVASSPSTVKYKTTAAIVDISTGLSRMVIAGNAGFTLYAAIDVDRATSHVVDFNLGLCTSPTSSAMTVWDTFSLAAGALKNADVLMLQIEENVPSAGQNTITAYLTQTTSTTPTLICSFVDTTNALAIDGTAAHRGMALFTNMNANGSQHGCGWDVWSYADIPA